MGNTTSTPPTNMFVTNSRANLISRSLLHHDLGLRYCPPRLLQCLTTSEPFRPSILSPCVGPPASTPSAALPGNCEIVLSEAVLVRVIVIEVLDIIGSSTSTSTRTRTIDEATMPPQQQRLNDSRAAPSL